MFQNEIYGKKRNFIYNVPPVVFRFYNLTCIILYFAERCYRFFGFLGIFIILMGFTKPKSNMKIKIKIYFGELGVYFIR